MSSSPQVTRFAPPERAPDHEVAGSAARFLLTFPFLRPFLDAMPVLVAVLNTSRQIIFANRAVLEFLGAPESAVLGRRPGEAMTCIHARREGAGCGCSEFCCTCGAVRAILAGQVDHTGPEECRISTHSGDAVDLRVWTTPFEADGEHLTLFAAQDVGHEKRRRALERIFFHDVLNTALGVRLTAGSLRSAHGNPASFADLESQLDQLIEEIEAQRQLAAAEAGDLRVTTTKIEVTSLLYEAAHLHGGDAGRARVVVEAPPRSLVVESDRILLRRVLGNLVRNAVEASTCGEEVTLSCAEGAGKISISVHNPAFMVREVQLQLFRRSFSTKGAGRGIGTYSVKLLVDRYLGGRVEFVSTVQEGTTFTVSLPTHGPSSKPRSPEHS